jgi:hypothetical protein
MAISRSQCAPRGVELIAITPIRRLSACKLGNAKARIAWRRNRHSDHPDYPQMSQTFTDEERHLCSSVFICVHL